VPLEQGFGFVALKESVYLSIAEAVLTHANPFKMKNTAFREVIGYLGGRVVVGNCKISECTVSNVGIHTEVKLEPANYIEAADWESNLYMKTPPEFMVGWWHSHFIGHVFSGVDILNHLGWQNPETNPHAIGLVFDPQEISEKNPGCVILKLEDPRMGEGSPVQTVDFRIQTSSTNRDDYLSFLKRELPQFFD